MRRAREIGDAGISHIGMIQNEHLEAGKPGENFDALVADAGPVQFKEGELVAAGDQFRGLICDLAVRQRERTQRFLCGLLTEDRELAFIKFRVGQADMLETVLSQQRGEAGFVNRTKPQCEIFEFR